MYHDFYIDWFPVVVIFLRIFNNLPNHDNVKSINVNENLSVHFSRCFSIFSNFTFNGDFYYEHT